LVGKPGSGKTVLAAAFLDHLKAERPDILDCYFFFDSVKSQTNSSVEAYRAMLSQILQKRSKNERLLDLFSFAMYCGSDGQPTAAPGELGELFNLCCSLPSIEDMFIVLDGLDECEDLESCLAAKLHHLARIPSVRMAFFSRPTVGPLIEHTPGLVSLNMGYSNSTDIRRYVYGELTHLRETRLLPSELDLEEIAQKLTRRADGMFLWVRLMITYLKCPALMPSERRTAISELDVPEGLEEMYERIINQIAKGGKAALKLASKVFMCLIHCRRELTPEELEDAIASQRLEEVDQGPRDIKNFVDIVITICGGFVEQESVELRLDNPFSQPFRFIHASVKEYLIHEDTRNMDRGSLFRGVVLLPSPPLAHIRFAALLVEYLMETIPAQPLSEGRTVAACAKDLSFKFPLLRYAASFWTVHLEKIRLNSAASGSSMECLGEYTSLVSSLEKFLAKPQAIMIWIEACYTFQATLRHECLISWAANFLGSGSAWSQRFPNVIAVATGIQQLGSSLEKTVRDWDSHLTKTPSCIWQEVGAFSPSPFILSDPEIKVKYYLAAEYSNPDLSSGPINKISSLTSDGKLDLVLSVYPTRYVSAD
jgi:hypothetical protein